MAEKLDPSRPSSAYTRQQADWAMLRTLMEGTGAMRAAGETYLPRHTNEATDKHKVRLSRATLTNFLEDAVRNASGLPFREPLTLNTNDAEIELLCENIDLRGNNLHVFASKAFEESVAMGLGYIWVDYPVAGDGETAKDQKGRRPYFVFKRPEEVLAVYATFVGGVQYITECRFSENEVVVKDFTETEIERVRVYRHDPTVAGFPTWELWEKGEKDWSKVGEGVITLPFIPMVPIYVGIVRSDFDVKPMFLDLAYKNVEHYQSSSDQRNILTVSRFPMLAVAGAKVNMEADDEAAIGPNTLLETENPQGKWYYVECTGAATEQGFKDIDRLEDQMRIMGLQPIVSDTGSVTATQRALDEAKAQTSIRKAANNLEDAINQALYIAGLWLGREVDAEVNLNEDYGIADGDAAEVAELIKMFQSGLISKKTFWLELQRRSFLAPSFDADAEAALIEEDGPSAADGGDVAAAAERLSTASAGALAGMESEGAQ